MPQLVVAANGGGGASVDLQRQLEQTQGQVCNVPGAMRAAHLHLHHLWCALGADPRARRAADARVERARAATHGAGVPAALAAHRRPVRDHQEARAAAAGVPDFMI